MTDAQIRLLGGGASQFSLSAGTPLTSVRQFDAGLFVNDDWRARPNLTFSYGLRYETQTNIGDHGDVSPRLALAWGIDGKGNQAAKTVLRAGFGIFFDRVNESVTLSELRYNGVTQQSYFILNPSFYPAIPSLAALAAGEAAAEPAVRGQRDESGAHLSDQHRGGPAGDQVREDQRGVSQRAGHSPVAVARHQRAD